MKTINKLLMTAGMTACWIFSGGHSAGPVWEARNYPPGASRDALKMVNNSTIDIKYFYSNLAHNGQTRWYEHEHELL